MRTKRSLPLLLCVTLTALLWAACLPTAALAENKRMNINYNGSITIEPTTLATGEAGWSATQRNIVITGTYADTLLIEGDRSPTGNVVRISGVGSDAAPMLLELSFVDIETSGTPFYIDGAAASNVTMTVLNDCTIHKNDEGSGSAITVPASSTFTVKGPGKLTVKASNDNANNDDARGSAFGGLAASPCGNIIFDGAYVEAYAECGAAIGGCNNTNFANNGGNILVKGGSRITATSTWGAAIGGGGGGGIRGEVCSGGDGGTLTIESGTVTATSTWGAAIGGGGGTADSGGSGGTLIMRGGILKATSARAAAIGGGSGIAMGAKGTVDLTGYLDYQWSNVDDTDASYQTTAFVNDNGPGFRGVRPASAAASTATGTTVDFGKVVKGTTPAAKTMVVTNMGREAITVSHTFAQGADNFTCSATPSTAVAATNGETVRLDLPPTTAALQAVGTYTANGMITATNTAAGYSQQYGFTVTMNVIDVPMLANIAAPPAIAHNGTLALPAIILVTDNDSPVTATGYQLSNDIHFATKEVVTVTTPIPYAKNGWYLRAFAENEAGRGYTNAVQITVIEPVVVDSVTVTPATASVLKGGTQGFAAAVSGTGSPAQTVTWSVAGKTSSGTQIDGSGTLTIGADETAATLIVTATSAEDTSKSGSATVTVASPLLTITPYGGTSYPVGGATENAMFRITATGAALDATHYGSATLDGRALDLGSLGRPGADGSVENGSIHVMINRAKLNTLTPGTHTLIVTLRDGVFAGRTVAGAITVTPHPVPKTGDNTPLRGWVLLMALSCCGVALLTFTTKRGV